MDKLNCIKDFYSGTKAYYLFQLGSFFSRPEYTSYILDKKYLTGAKVAFISNIMLGIKEDLVDNKGAMEYQSKIFLKSLEDSVSYIATKVENGYKVGNYIFPDAPTLVAIVRNKLAHGKYTIDFEHNRVILNHKGIDIIINVDKLVGFIMLGFKNTIHDVRCASYERNVVYIIRKTDKLEKNKIRDLKEAKKIIKSYNCVKFKIESLNGMPVFSDCIEYLDNFLKYVDANPYEAMKSDYYKKLKEYLKKRNCIISVEYKKMDDDNEISRILRVIDNGIINNDNLTYEQQLRLIGMEVQRSVDNKFNTFNAMAADVNNLVILDAITKTKSIDNEIISSYLDKNCLREIKCGYDEYGMSLISMFNSLFMYPFDDVYSVSGEYTPNRSDGIDFGSLDLSMINPIVISIDDSPLVTAKEKLDSIVKKQVHITKKILRQQDNLGKVTGNKKAEGVINQNINDLRTTLSSLITDYIVADSEYNTIRNDYTINSLYFKNKAIIEGIRNSIAHGHYEIIGNGNLMDSIIVFNDIYDGKLTFKVQMTFGGLEELISINDGMIMKFVDSKVGQLNNNARTK